MPYRADWRCRVGLIARARRGTWEKEKLEHGGDKREYRSRAGGDRLPAKREREKGASAEDEGMLQTAGGRKIKSKKKTKSQARQESKQEKKKKKGHKQGGSKSHRCVLRTTICKLERRKGKKSPA